MKIYRNVFDKKALATLFIVLLIGLSWLGNIDKHADKYTHESIVQAGTAYAAARGINAAVSVLQTSTVEVSFIASGSISVGELLDPINDLIERFSSVMVVAFSSLVLQKILLVIITHEIFNSAVTLLGIILIMMIYVGKVGAVKAVMRVFILFAFVRFSLGIVISLNSIVDYVFLDSQLVTRSEGLTTFRSDLSAINKDEYVVAENIMTLNASIKDSESRIAHLEMVVIQKLRSRLDEAVGRVADSEAMLQSLEKDNLWHLFGINESQEVKAVKVRLSNYEDARDHLLKKISDKESRVEDIKEDIISKHEDIDDENNESLGMLWEAIPIISNIRIQVNAAIENVIDLIVLFVLKTVLIPLLFFYALIKVARGIWDVDLENVFVGNNQVAVSGE